MEIKVDETRINEAQNGSGDNLLGALSAISSTIPESHDEKEEKRYQ